jgi:signal transduction histidine kinase
MKDRLSLLVADDECIIRRRVRCMLDDSFLIEEADSAQAARKASQRDFDAILLDVMFPDGNGIELCAEIKAKDPFKTVLISSSLDTLEAWNGAFDAGADGYLEKRELLGLDPRKTALTISNLVERNRLKRDAQETNRRQTELLSILSHDVRAPFQTLLGTVELLKKSNIPPNAAKNVETIYKCAKNQIAFINSLLELLRLESGKCEVQRYPLDLAVPVNQCVEAARILAEAKDLLLETQVISGNRKILGDIGKVCQLVNNLITNAVKFTPRGGKVLVTIQPCDEPEFPGVELMVEDNGLGIPEKDRSQIFERFHKGRARGTEGETGTGLGLAICKEIVQLLNGAIDIDDNHKAGTRIRVRFPSVSVDAKLLNRSCLSGPLKGNNNPETLHGSQGNQL